MSLHFSKFLNRNVPNLSLIFLKVLLANALNTPKNSCPSSFTVFVPSFNQSGYCPLPWADFTVLYVSARARPSCLLYFQKNCLASLIECPSGQAKQFFSRNTETRRLQKAEISADTLFWLKQPVLAKIPYFGRKILFGHCFF